MDFYTENLALIKNKNPNLAQKIEEVKEPILAEVIQTKIGFPTLRVRNNGDRGILLHSAYDPIKEARNLISGYKLEETQFLIVLGFGLGYHIREILKTCPWIKLVVVIEPNLSLFKKALNLLDLSELLLSPKVKLILEKTPLNIEKEIRTLGQILLTGKSSLVLHPSSCHILGENLTLVKKAINDALLWSRANLTTNIKKGEVFQKNILTNLPQVIKNSGIRNLFGKFKDKPVILVAAGPSLDKNVHLLSKVKDKALVICVDAALRAMLQHNIKPDIVVSIDYGQGTRNLFEGIMDQTKDLFLAADPEVYPKVLSDFKGGKFIININKPLTLWLSSFVKDKGLLQKGSSVAHAAFSIAEAVGGDPIILIGQDLSYPDGFTHSQGSTPRRKVLTGIDKKTDKRYLLSQDKNGKWIGRDLIMVEDIYGNKVPTDEAMYSYLRFLEGMIKETKAVCIDATEGGAKIRGTKIMSLQEVIDKYCTKYIKVRQTLEKAANQKEEVMLEELKKYINKNILRLKEISFWAKQGQTVIAKLYCEVKKKRFHLQERNRLIRESNYLKDKITKIEPYLHKLIEGNMFSYLYLIKRRDNLRLDQFKGKKKMLTQIEKVAIFYDGMRKASEKLSKDFQTTLDRLNKEFPESQ